MKKLLFIFLLFVGVSYSQVVYVTNNRYEANVKQVYMTDDKYEADVIVKITDDKYKARNSDKYWYFTDNKYEAQILIYITDNKYSADIKVYIED